MQHWLVGDWLARYPERRRLFAASEIFMSVTLNVDPANLEIVRYALDAYKQGSFVAALPGLRVLVSLNDRSPEAHFALAMALEHGSTIHFPECYAHFERALELRPDWFDALYNYGRTLLHSSREREAEAVLTQALKQQPSHPGVQESLAMSLIEQIRFEEALPFLERAVELMPEKEKLRQERDRVRDAVNSAGKHRKLARFPRKASEFDDVSRIIDEYILTDIPRTAPFLHSATKVFTMGSCFASNIAIALRRYGVLAEHVEQAEEINSTYANRYLMEWIAHGETDKTKNLAASFGEKYRARVAQLLVQSDIFVLSLGVAPCFFDRTTGEFAPTQGTNLHTSLLIKKYEFRTTSVSENLENLNEIVKIVRQINPKMQIILTVSPVPLKATFERPSAIVADCISKSTLRVTAHEFMSSDAGAGVIYWPSFEIVRWLGGHVGRVFVTDDGSPLHADQALIDLIMGKFVARFGDSDLRLRTAV
jgi:tetratricopeptide (TPR) repeat protein